MPKNCTLYPEVKVLLTELMKNISEFALINPENIIVCILTIFPNYDFYKRE